jgi:hypothetical protein
MRLMNKAKYGMYLRLAALTLAWIIFAQASSASDTPFDVTVTADFEGNGAGRDVDTIAFWEAPDPADALMFVTSKGEDLVEVWVYPYTAESEQQPLQHECIDDGSNGVVVDQAADLLYVAVRHSLNVCVFQLPALDFVKAMSSGTAYHDEPNLALLDLPDGSQRLYVSDDNIIYIHDPATGELLGDFNPLPGNKTLETMIADPLAQVLYVPDENGHDGVYAVNPDGQAYTRNGTTVFGGDDIIDADGEGILIYTCYAEDGSDIGSGFIAVSDQIEETSIGNDYEFFDRQTWAYLGKLKLKRPDGDFVANTDGIASTQQHSDAFAQGLLAAIDDDSAVVGVSWRKILEATGLNCPTDTD